MKKILVLNKDQYNAVVNVVKDAVKSVNFDYSEESIENTSDEDDYFVFSGTELPSEHRALESIDWKDQTEENYKPMACPNNFSDLTIDEAKEFVRLSKDLYENANNALECKMAQAIQEWAKEHPNVSVSEVYKSNGNTILYLGEDVTGWTEYRMSDVLEILKSYKPKWTTILDFPKHQETEDDHNNSKPLFDSFEEAMTSAQEMAEQFAIDVMHASVQDDVTCHIHVHQYATPEFSKSNVIEVYNDEEPEWPHFDYRVEVKRV